MSISIPTQADLHQLASLLRRALELGMEGGLDGNQLSTGSCLYASLAFSVSLHNFTSAPAEIRGGNGSLDEGALGMDGRWYGHYWVEVETAAGEKYVVDLTADQFAHAAVFVVPLEVARTRYRPGRQDYVDEAAVDLAESFGEPHMARLSARRLLQGQGA